MAIQIDVDMPKNCWECLFSWKHKSMKNASKCVLVGMLGYYNVKQVEKGEKDTQCPLKEVK